MNDLLLQLVADQCGVAVARPCITETTALGAAFLAGLAEGVWGVARRGGRRLVAPGTFEPAARRGAVDARHEAWLLAVERSRN